jgi:hypothetical protein
MPSKPKAKPAPALSPKQARFVSEYLRDQNATQAAIRAGYSEGTAKQQGSRLLTNDAVWGGIQKRLQNVARKADVTAESLTRELEEARRMSLKTKQPSAAVAATLGKAKLAGLLVERHKHSGAIGTYDLTALTDEQLNALESILGPLAHAGGDPGGEGEA